MPANVDGALPTAASGGVVRTVQAPSAAQRIERTLQIAGDRLTRCIELLLAIACIAAIFLCFVNVVARYAFGQSLLFADEVEVFVVVWITFLGAAVVSWRRAHLRMDVFFQAMPMRVRRVITTCELIATMVLVGYAAYQSWLYAVRMWQLGSVSNSAGIPMWFPHAAVLIGFGLITVFCAYFLVQSPKSPEAQLPGQGADNQT
jgi:TRAP-type transport system small permease protein